MLTPKHHLNIRDYLNVKQLYYVYKKLKIVRSKKFVQENLKNKKSQISINQFLNLNTYVK